jgi:DNA-binding GntR family transcriptional regulator
MASVPGIIEHGVFWHGHIVDAVAAADSTAAEDAMRMHLREIRADLRRTILGDDATQLATSGPG